MKQMRGIANRDASTKTVFTSGSFTYELIPDYGCFPEGYEFTMYPSGCCDKEDNLFLTSRNLQHPIVMLDAQGNYVKDFGKGLFQETHGICVTPQNTLLCPDTALHVVRELTMDGELLRDLGNLGVPSDSGYDPNIWRKLQRQGKLIPTDVVFDNNWAFSLGLQSIKRAAPPFNRPTGVVVGPQGDIFVSDGYGNASIHRFSPDGTLLKTWGGHGDEPGKFIIPHCIWCDRLGRLWVGDREGNRVHVFNENGELLAYLEENLYQPTEIWADNDYVYIAERGGGVTIVNMDLEVEAQIGFYNSPIRAHGMCGNSKGDLFLMPLTTYDRHYLMKLARIR